ncbi:DUF6527 family protein [Rhizobium ruizarguesonis]|uniref:DUF6527 family protein n=1 Tax=Rhizobium ruizarguesonis TaxID=2081791 RepID=UPI0038577E79
MKSPLRLKHSFVEGFPDRLEKDTLYVSVEHASMAHLCACGCGTEVITPLSPTDWRFTFNGKTISVEPSVGNWSLTCRSHYIIRHNLVHWADNWSEERIAAGRKLDLERKRSQEAHEPKVPVVPRIPDQPARGDLPAQVHPQPGVISRLWKFFTGDR